MAYQHKLTHHRIEETANSEDTTLVFATYFGENELEDDLGEEHDDKLEDKHKDNVYRTIWRTISGQA